MVQWLLQLYAYCGGSSAVPKGKSREMGIRVVYKCFFSSFLFFFFPAISVSLARPRHYYYCCIRNVLYKQLYMCSVHTYIYIYIYINPAQKMDGTVVMTVCGGGGVAGALVENISLFVLHCGDGTARLRKMALLSSS